MAIPTRGSTVHRASETRAFPTGKSPPPLPGRCDSKHARASAEASAELEAAKRETAEAEALALRGEVELKAKEVERLEEAGRERACRFVGLPVQPVVLEGCSFTTATFPPID